eukprot:scaffold284375_cov71-Attheya_sp.AAC.6
MHTIRELDTVMPTLHVKGHQDNDIPESELSYEARLNIQADILATEHGNTTNVATNMYTIRHRNALYTLTTKSSQEPTALPSQHYHIINFDSYKDSSSHWLPINNRVYERGQSPSNLCTTCNDKLETERHFLVWCTRNQQDRAKPHEALWKVFNKHNVDPNLRKVICQCLDISIADEPTYTREWSELTDIPREYEALINAQEKVGIHQLWYGRIPLEYDRYQ